MEQARDGRGPSGPIGTPFVALCPEPPGWRLDWAGVEAALPWIRALEGCPQDPRWHREGDVLVHTRMVCEALVALPAWRALAPPERHLLFAAALLHDVAKPACLQRDPQGGVSTRGHPARGEVMARLILWRLGAPVAWRESVAALVRHHQVPFFVHRRPDRRRLVIGVAQATPCDRLALLAEADARGHVCPDQDLLFEGIAAFVATAAAEGCLAGPRPFGSEHARFLYLRDGDGDPETAARRDPDAPAPEPGPARVVLVCGPPGAGKQAWTAERCPAWPIVVQEDPLLPAGQVPETGRALRWDRSLDMPRALLNDAIPFVWFGTFLTRRQRERALGLAAAAGAMVRIVHVEAPEATLFAWNRRRQRPLPGLDLRRLLDGWEVPWPGEAHRVDWLANP